MNIALVVHRFDEREGTGGYTVCLARALAGHHDLTIYANQFISAPPESASCISVPAWSGRASSMILSFARGFEAVRQRHDVVHAQGWVAARAEVVTAHIVLQAWRRHAEAAHVRAPLGERLFGTHIEKKERDLFRTAQRVIAPSAQTGKDLASCYDVAENVVVVPHGFPPIAKSPISKSDRRQELGFPDTPVALYVGDARKGLSQAIAGVCRVPDVTLVVVSHSPERAYRRQANELGLGARLRWLGGLRSVDAVYQSADVLLHPSIYDTFGLVVAEACSHGLPSIVSPNAGVSELLTHRQNGWVLESNDAEHIAHALTSLLTDSSLHANLSAGSRDVARTRTWQQVAEDTASVYREIG